MVGIFDCGGVLGKYEIRLKERKVVNMEALNTYKTEKTLAEQMNERLAEMKMTKAEAAQNREEWGGKKPGWQPEGEIPSYILKDGAYPQMDSLLIGEKYEQFNEKGENVSRTVIF